MRLASCEAKEIKWALEINFFCNAGTAAGRKDGGRFVLMPAGVTAPKVAHAPLIDIPRNPGGYGYRAAVGAMVKFVSRHKRTPKS